VLFALPGGWAPSVARKSPAAARITARFWRQHDDGDADSDGGTERLSSRTGGTRTS
jgi:hypothetical protein